jgi:hypothetical protein
MADGRDLLDKADALMRRHRVFVAGGAQPAAATPEPDEEDIPVLTEVVAGEAAAVDTASPPPDPDRVATLARELLFERLPVLRQALAEELAVWLDAELPHVIVNVLDGVTDQLVARISAEAQAALLPKLQAALEAEPSAPRHD